MLAFLFEVLGEILLQVFLEALAEFGLHAVAAPFRKSPNPWVASVRYAIFGAIGGGISLLVVPAHLVEVESLRILNLICTPIVAGLAMSFIGAWRLRRGESLLRLDRFAYGYLFALSLAVVRFIFAK